MNNRRLPVYILADCSGSMQGAPIESVNAGIAELHRNLLGNPQAVENAYLSVITFDTSARQVAPLTEVLKFQPPTLQAAGLTAMGDALKVLCDCLVNEVKKSTPEQKGDWRPLVFLFTDGSPTDDISSFSQQLKDAKPAPANIIALACGTEGDPQALKQITNTVMVMRDMGSEAFAQYFKWVSSTVTTASTKIDQSPTAAAAGLQAPPPPSGTIELVF